MSYLKILGKNVSVEGVGFYRSFEVALNLISLGNSLKSSVSGVGSEVRRVRGGRILGGFFIFSEEFRFYFVCVRGLLEGDKIFVNYVFCKGFRK